MKLNLCWVLCAVFISFSAEAGMSRIQKSEGVVTGFDSSSVKVTLANGRRVSISRKQFSEKEDLRPGSKWMIAFRSGKPIR